MENLLDGQGRESPKQRPHQASSESQTAVIEKRLEARKQAQDKPLNLLGYTFIAFVFATIIAAGLYYVKWTSLPLWLAQLSHAGFAFTIGGIVAAAVFTFGTTNLLSKYYNMKYLPWVALALSFIAGGLTFVTAGASLPLTLVPTLAAFTPTVLSLVVAGSVFGGTVLFAFTVKLLMVLIPAFAHFIKTVGMLPRTLVNTLGVTDGKGFWKGALQMLLGYGVLFSVVALITFLTGGGAAAVAASGAAASALGLPLLTPALAALSQMELSFAIAGIVTGSFLGVTLLGVIVVELSQFISKWRNADPDDGLLSGARRRSGSFAEADRLTFDSDSDSADSSDDLRDDHGSMVSSSLQSKLPSKLPNPQLGRGSPRVGGTQEEQPLLESTSSDDDGDSLNPDLK